MKIWRHCLFLLVFTALAACGGGDDSLDGLGTFEPPDNQSPDGEDNQAPDNPADVNTIVVAVEATEAMLAPTLAQRVIDFLLPAKAYAEVEAGGRVLADITVEQVNYRGEPISNGIITTGDYDVFYDSVERNYSIRFNGSIPSRLDLVIFAELDNDVILRRALPNTNVGIRVNIVTEHVVNRFFSEELFDSQADLDELINCVESDSDCQTQAQIHLTNWLSLNDSVLIYELEFTDSDDKADALAKLQANPLLEDYISRFMQASIEPKLPPLAGDTSSPVINNRVGKYNTVMLSLGLNQGRPESSSGNRTTVFSNRISKVKETLLGDIPSYTLPSVTLAGGGFSIFPDTLVELIPWQRHSMTQTGASRFTLNNGPLESEITCSSAQLSSNNEISCIGGTFPYLSSVGLYDSPRSRIQTITQAKGVAPNGWNTNPFFQQYYTVKGDNNSGFPSESLASAYLSNGRIYSLTPEDFSERLAVLEQVYTAGWVFSTKETEDSTANEDDGFELDTLNLENYGVIHFGQAFADEPLIAVQAGLSYWRFSDNEVDATAGPENNLQTFQLQRSADLTTSGILNSPTAADSYLLDQLSNAISAEAADVYEGRISLTDNNGDVWEGNSDPLGNILALVRDSELSGQSIAIAVKSSSQPNLSNATYRITGNSFGLSSEATWLDNHNFSHLDFDAQGNAQLTLESRRISQQPGSSLLSDPAVVQFPVQPIATPAVAGKGIPNHLELSFSDPSGGEIPLNLEGFAASNDNLLILIMRYGEQLGLLFGYKEQNLTADSD